MKQPRYVYKDKAKENLSGKYGVVIPINIIFGLILGTISSISTEFAAERSFESGSWQVVDPGNPALATLLNVIVFIISAFFAYALARMYIQLARDEKPVIEETVTLGFTDKPIRSVVLHLLMNIFILLWSLLLIIPGIVKSYAYSMSFYLLHRKPDLSASDAIDLSKKYTNGRKMDLFTLDLSYLLMYFLGIFTFFILWLWIVPKHMTARTLYFDEIYAEMNPVKPKLDLDEEEKEEEEY
ncbi:MAG: DUF975 family protein [Acholeplasmataceae bacterium]